MAEHTDLERAIEALEARRAELGDEVVEPLLEAARERLAMAAPQDEEARRRVTVLFCEVAASGASIADQSAELLHELDGAVLAHGGRVDKHAGSILMALWGADGSREDDAERALHCALALREHGLGKGMALRIGINTGPALVGAVGTIGERSATGDAVNIASRLKDVAAPGEVVVGRDTHDLARAAFLMVPAGELRIRGKTQLVAAYRLVHARPRGSVMPGSGVDGVATRLVGRAEELARLEAVVAEAWTASRARTVAILGEAGVGKSRLVFELLRSLRERHREVRILRARAEAASSSSPWAILRQLLAECSGIGDADGEALVRDKLEHALRDAGGTDDGVAERAHLAGHLVGFDLSGSPHLAPLLGGEGAAEQLRDRGLAALAALVAGPGRPVVVVVEDVQWADASSMDGLRRIASLAAGTPFALVVTARPFDGDAPALVAGAQAVSLAPLAEPATRELVGQLLSRVVDVPGGLETLLVERGEGNPFFVEELVRMLLDDGILRRDGPGFTVDAGRLHLHRMPATLTGVVQARLDALPSSERRLLQRAAVMGRQFWEEGLRALGDGDDLRELLQGLERREMVFRLPGRDGEHIFKHAILRDVAYESMLVRDRRQAHLRIAAWLRDAPGIEPGRRAALRAEHLERGGSSREASTQLLVAARDAARRFANVEAIALLHRALALGTDAAFVFEATEVREGLLDLLGRRDEQRGDVAVLERLAHEAANPAWKVEAALRRAHLGVVTGDYPAAQAALASAHRELPAVDDVRLSARTLQEEASLCAQVGEPGRSAALLGEALPLARASGDPRLELAVLVGLGVASYRTGDAEGARRAVADALAIARRIGDRGGESRCLNLLGGLANRAGDVEEALRRFREALAVAEQAEDRRAASIPLVNLGMTLDGLGRYEEARELLETFLRIKREIDDRPGEVWGFAHLGLVLHHLGDDAAAASHARRAVDLARELGDKANEVVAWTVLGHALHAEGRAPEAREAYGTALELQRALGSPAEALAWMALALLQAGSIPEARAGIEELLLVPDAADEPLVVPWACACVLEASGDPRAAAFGRRAAEALRARADRIADPSLRSSFLNDVALHRRLLLRSWPPA